MGEGRHTRRHEAEEEEMGVVPPEDRSEVQRAASSRKLSTSGTAYLGAHEDDAARRERHRKKRERRDRHRQDGDRNRERHGGRRDREESHREYSQGGGDIEHVRTSEHRSSSRRQAASNSSSARPHSNVISTDAGFYATPGAPKSFQAPSVGRSNGMVSSSACEIFFPPQTGIQSFQESPQKTDRSSTSFLDTFSSLMPFCTTVNCEIQTPRTSAQGWKDRPVHPSSIPAYSEHIGEDSPRDQFRRPATGLYLNPVGARSNSGLLASSENSPEDCAVENGAPIAAQLNESKLRDDESPDPQQRRAQILDWVKQSDNAAADFDTVEPPVPLELPKPPPRPRTENKADTQRTSRSARSARNSHDLGSSGVHPATNPNDPTPRSCVTPPQSNRSNYPGTARPVMDDTLNSTRTPLATPHPKGERPTTPTSFSAAIDSVGFGSGRMAVRATMTERFDKSLFVFKHGHPTRKVAKFVVQWWWFQQAVLLAIIGSTMLLCIEDPLADSTPPSMVFLDYLFSSFFICEFAFKVVAMGLVLNDDAYLRDSWNVIDFMCVLSSVAGMIPSLSNAGAVKVLRTFRVLRPLLAIKRFKTLQLLLNTLFKSMLRIVDMMLVLVLFVVFMGIVGLELFGGTFLFRCYETDAAGTALQEAEVTRLCDTGTNPSLYHCKGDQVCQAYPQNPNGGVTSFDNVLVAMLAVFQSLTLEGWVDIMYFIMDTNGALVGIVFSLTLLVIGGFLLMNLALAVVYDSYMENKEEGIRAAEVAEQAEREMKEEERRRRRALGIEDEEDTTTLSARLKRMSQSLSFRTSFNLEEEDEEAKKNHSSLRKFAEGSLFDNFIMCVILINVLVMCMYRYDNPPALMDFIDQANNVCSAIFLLEFVLKLAAVGVARYFSDGFNVFDFALVSVSVISFVMDTMASSDGSSLGSLTALRALRVVRMFKLVRKWKQLYRFCITLKKAGASVAPFLVVFIIVMLNCALIGMNLFAGKLQGRFNYDNTPSSMLTSFQLATGENWNDTMYDAIQNAGWVAAPYFVAVFFLMNTLLLNIVVSILIDNCQEGVEDEEEDGTEAKEESNPLGESSPTAEDDESNKAAEPRWLKRPTMIVHDGGPADPMDAIIKRDNGVSETRRDVLGMLGSDPMAKDNEERVVLEGNAFMVLSVDNPVRTLLHKVISSTSTEIVVASLIILSAIILALDNPNVDHYSDSRTSAMTGIGIFFTVVFTLEMLVKMIVMGVVVGPNAYLRDTWNMLDFFTVSCSLAALAEPNAMALRALRALRPMRLFSRQASMKIVVESLGTAMMSSANACAVGAFLFTIFTVSGVQLFSGTLFKCTDETVEWQTDCNGLFVDPETGLEANRTWVHASQAHFDDIPSAVVTLFELATQEGWPDTVMAAVDSQGVGRGPKKNARVWTLSYFFCTIILAAFFYLNLFVGLVVEVFTYLSSTNLTDGLPEPLRMWDHILRLAKPRQPKVLERRSLSKNHPFQLYLRAFCEHRWFDSTMIGLIVLNVMLLAVQYHNQPQYWTDLCSVGLEVLSWIFFVEMVVKIVGLGYRDYFRNAWNTFDCVIVILTTLLPLLGMLGVPMPNLRVLRIVRILRATRVLRTMKGVNTLIGALISSVPECSAVLAVIMIITYVYAIMGMYLFGGIDYETQTTTLSAYANFSSFPIAMLMMIRCMTGEGYNAIMQDIYNCGSDDCGASWLSYPFFITYTFVVQLMLLNLFVAVVLNQYSNSLAVGRSYVRDEHIDAFTASWAEEDPTGSGFMPASRVHEFLIALEPPLGMKCDWRKIKRSHVTQLMRGFHIPVYRTPAGTKVECFEGDTFFVAFKDILLLLCGLAMLKKTNDDAHRLTIALSLQHQLAALEESEIPEPTPTFLTRSLSLMGLAPTPTEATQTILVKSEFHLDQYITVQAVELAWIWIKQRSSLDHKVASVQVYKGRLAALEGLMRERHLMESRGY